MHAMHGSLAAARASRRRPRSAARGYVAALLLRVADLPARTHAKTMQKPCKKTTTKNNRARTRTCAARALTPTRACAHACRHKRAQRAHKHRRTQTDKKNTRAHTHTHTLSDGHTQTHAPHQPVFLPSMLYRLQGGACPLYTQQLGVQPLRPRHLPQPCGKSLSLCF